MTGDSGQASEAPDSDTSLKALGGSILDRFTRSSSGSIGLSGITRLRLFAPTSLPGLAALATFSATCGTIIVFVLNKEAALIQDRQFALTLALLFAVVLVAHRTGQKALISRTSSAIEQSLDEWRSRIGEKVLRLSLRDTEQFSRGQLLDGMVRAYEQLTQTIVPLVAGVESAILLVFMLGYLLTLSVAAGIMTVVIASLLVMAYLNTAGVLQGSLQQAGRATAIYARRAEDLVHGFKELKLGSDRREAVLKDFVHASRIVAARRSRTAAIVSELMASFNSASFLLAAAVVFLMPVIVGTDSGVSRIVTAVLFLLGPISGVVGAAQHYATAQFAIEAIREFEHRIESLLSDEPAGPDYRGFQTLSLVQASYGHLDQSGEQGFSVDGLNAEIRRGQIAFVTGANGSGKTTALRLLTGLYPLQRGAICIDGITLSSPVPQSYRELFATVFADYHLFAKPYALDEAGLARLERALDIMRIRDKLPTDITTELNRDALSTGQRKRLAFALALAEDRPILLLDEWAADQDPQTRERFYREILPSLKAQGLTIIAITHDERYFDCADIRFHMDEGRLERVTP